MAINGLLIVFIEMILVYSLEGKKTLTFFIRAGVFLIGVSYAVLNFLPTGAITAVLAIVIITLGEILSMPFMNSFWVSRSSENNRGQYAAMYTVAWSIAQIAAPIIGSEIVTAYGYNRVWWLLAAICLCTSIGFSLLGKALNNKTTLF